MESILNSIMFKDIQKTKLEYLYNKYKDVKINIDLIQNITDKDEIIFCYYFMKYQQNIEINSLGFILTNLSIN